MPPADTGRALPLSDAEIATLLAPFAGARTIALAVSGGGDSLGMLAAVARWRPPTLSVVVLTVDHRLQAGSAKVAAGVAKTARRLGLAARVLQRKGPAPTSNIEGAARAARYALLMAAARQARASHLLTAHQRDDLAEGFLMRLKRRAGVFGLAAMRPMIDLDALTLARPFLAVPRERLHATAVAAGLTPFDDPMNADPRFERVRVRKLLPVLAGLGLDIDTLALAAERFGDATDVIERAASAFLASAVRVDAFSIAWLDVDRFGDLPQAVGLRVLVRIVTAVGGSNYPPRRDRLFALQNAICTGGGSLKRTLAGTVIQARSRQLAFYREVGRGGLPSQPLAPGRTGTWDRRFGYMVAADAPRDLVLSPLAGPAKALPFAIPAGVPSTALATLPAVFRRGKALDFSPIPERFPSDRMGYVALRCLLRDRLDHPQAFPDFGAY